MTGSEILIKFREALDELNITVYQFLNGDYSSTDAAQLIALIGETNCVYNERDAYKNNNELNDEEHVIHFKDHNVFILFESEYSSWDAPRYGDYYLVEPYEVKTTKYARIK